MLACTIDNILTRAKGSLSFREPRIYAWISWNSKRIVILVENCTSERGVEFRRPNSHTNIIVFSVVISLQSICWKQKNAGNPRIVMAGFIIIQLPLLRKAGESKDLQIY